MGTSTPRLLTWLLVLGVLGPLALVACLAAEPDWSVGWIVCLGLAVVSWPVVVAGVPRELPRSPRRPVWIALVVIGLLACVMTAGTATFMADPADKRFALSGSDGFLDKHNCFTCLPIGAHLAREGAANIYDRKHYRGAKGADRTPVHDQVGKVVTIDSLPYPPPALLIPQVLASTGHGFLQLRSYWYVLSAFALFLTLLCVAGFAGGFRGHTGLLAFPIVLLAPNVIGTLQIGNIQILVVAFSLLGMIAFAKEWNGIGGLLLGYAVLVKVWPGVLLLYLLLGKRYRAVGSTVVAMILFVLATLAAFGTAAIAAFLEYQLPRLISGEAFGFMRSVGPMLANISVFSWPPKLHLLGFVAPHSLIPDTLMWSYTGFLLLMVAWAGLRLARRDAQHPLNAVRVWLALIVLAELRSPFLPGGYGVIPVLMLLATFLAGSGAFRVVVTLIVFVVVALHRPLFEEADPKHFHVWFSLVVSAIAFVTAMAALLPVLLGKLTPGVVAEPPTEQ